MGNKNGIDKKKVDVNVKTTEVTKGGQLPPPKGGGLSVMTRATVD